MELTFYPWRAKRSSPVTLAAHPHGKAVVDFQAMIVPEPLITTSPDRLGGTPVFAGTRVPVQTLIDHLEGGDSLEVFLDDFPSVSREYAIAVLDVAKSALLAQAVVD